MGNQSKIIQVVVIAIAMFGAFWFTSSAVTLPEFSQAAILISAAVIAAILLIKRKLPFDFKLLSLALLGYAFGGKGFAYITPFEPVYIGEITLCICALGLLFRYFRGSPLLPTHLHVLILLWMIMVGCYLLAGFDAYRLMAIRDSAIAYYALFFFAAFAMFLKEETSKAFRWVLLGSILLSYIGCILVVTGIYDKIIPQVFWVRRLFLPHADSFIPLVAAGAAYGLLIALTRRSLVHLLIGGVGFLLLMGSKTAGVFCLGTVMLLLIFASRRIDLLFASIFLLTFSAVAFGILVASGSTFAEKVLESDQIKTLQDVGEATGKANTSTSDWRIAWWTIVVEDTMKDNPLTGVGMGGDITGHFLESVMNMDPNSIEAQEYARYPHNIIFTVFGRMGFIGLTLFSILFLFLMLFGYSFARRYFRGTTLDPGALMAFVIFFGGLMNSLVQATYEVPHGAIMNWACLGYLVAFDYRQRLSQSFTRKPLSFAPRPVEHETT